MEPKLIDGFECYAPEIAFENDGFPPEQYAKLFEAEERNFWFRSRNRVLQHLVRKYLGDAPARLIEIGCGNGTVLKALSRFENLELTGAEAYLSGLRFARQRLPGVEFIQLDAARMPFGERYDAVGIFDVLEHIEADEVALRNFHRVLKTGGYLFVTVPQHPSLWSANDDAACHKRRYTRRELEEKLRRTGFASMFLGSFVSTLIGPMWLSRKLKRVRSASSSYDAVMEELDIPGPLNALLDLLMRVDEIAIRCGISLPVGGSLVAVARKLD